MSGNVFVDSNVFVYQVDASEPAKSAATSAWLTWLWEHGSGRVSTQVLQEFYNVVTRKLSERFPRDDARLAVRQLDQWEPVVLDIAVIEDAFTVEDRYGLSWWDALIVAAARSAGCAYLLTEDLQHGQDYGGVQVVDFQVASPGEVLTAD